MFNFMRARRDRREKEMLLAMDVIARMHVDALRTEILDSLEARFCDFSERATLVDCDDLKKTLQSYVESETYEREMGDKVTAGDAEEMIEEQLSKFPVNEDAIREMVESRLNRVRLVVDDE
jgi:hypothetical protein